MYHINIYFNFNKSLTHVCNHATQLSDWASQPQILLSLKVKNVKHVNEPVEVEKRTCITRINRFLFFLFGYFRGNV